VKKLGLFGSYAKGNEGKKSDIDFLVEFKETNADNYFELLYLLEKTFKNKKIDLILESGLKPEVKYVIEETEYVKI
jgi:predicted nucleotidyltransferase